MRAHRQMAVCPTREDTCSLRNHRIGTSLQSSTDDIEARLYSGLYAMVNAVFSNRRQEKGTCHTQV